MKRLFFSVGFACALGVSVLADSQATSKPAPPAPSAKATGEKPAANGIAPSDQAFVKEAAMGGMAEVDLGQLAASKASDADVKQFGQRMVDDHGKANDELKSWASSKSVMLPAELDAKHKADHARLEKLSGAAFDKAYMTAMVTDHNEDVAAFQREAKAAKDPDLKSWIGKTLPTLQDHQKSAKEISGKVHGAAATKKSNGK